MGIREFRELAPISLPPTSEHCGWTFGIGPVSMSAVPRMFLRLELLACLRAIVAWAGVGLVALTAVADTPGENSLPAFSREESDSQSEFIVNTWKTGEGLPANEIQSLRQTPDGYLWLGTQHGLVRFDGVRFQSFFTAPTGARYSTRVDPLEVDAKGRLWFAPDQVGVIYYERGVFHEVLTNEPSLKARVEDLRHDGTNGVMWVDANGGLGRISHQQPAQAEPVKGGNSSGLSKWVRDFEGNLWLVNARGLKLYKSAQWRDVAVPGTASLVATARREGGLWIAREARLRTVLTNGNSQPVAEVPWKGQSRVQCMLEDSRNRLWIGTVGQGIYCYANSNFTQVVPAPGSITSLIEDTDGNIWAGTRGGGLIRIRQRHFFVRDLSSGLRNEFVRSLAQDESGKVWLLSAEGSLGWWQDETWHQLGEAEGWLGQDSLCITPARGGGIWVSTARRGIWRWKDGKLTRQSLGAKPPKEPAVDLLEDKKGRLWMVTDNSGIYCLEGGALKNYSVPEGLPSALMRRMIEDELGQLWAADWEGGISRWNDGRWELLRSPSGHSDAVRTMVATNGALWLGTSSSGLLRFKDGKTDRISVEQGLPDSHIRQLLLDGRGSLWGGTPHKLFRVSLAQLNAVLDGKEERIEAVAYGRSDGLPDTSFASWSDPRCWRTSDGELWFATANGAVHFRPDNLPRSSSPQVLMEQVLLDGKPKPISELKNLRPGLHRVEFRFTAPCLTAPERVRFRYQLSGVDSDWIDAGATRTAAYPSVPIGDHEFRVQVSSPEGVWSSQPVTVGLSIHPHFWQTSWFLAGITAGLAGGGVWLVRRATVRRLNHRLEELRRQQTVDRERTRIAQDIHDELGASLTRIGLLADMGTRHKFDPPAVTRDLGQISRTARESVAAMDAIVWALNPRNDSLDHFANYVAQYTREFFRPTTVRTRLDLPVDLPAHPLAAETRHELFCLVKESFNNVVRHAEASEVQLSLACENGHLRLVIADNGKGLSPQTTGAGRNGLINLHERIERLGGTLRIESKPGAGVRLDFVLPLAKLQTN